jgi:hypothetical protein
LLDTRANEQNRGSPSKSIPPRKLERQEGGFSVGTVFIRSFGIWFLYEIRRYKSIEKCHGRSVAALRERNFEEQMDSQVVTRRHCLIF